MKCKVWARNKGRNMTKGRRRKKRGEGARTKEGKDE